MHFSIRPLKNDSDNWLNNLLAENWGSQYLVSRGRLYDASQCSGFVAVHGPSENDGILSEERVMGVILYQIMDDACEICVVHTLVENQGIGSALIDFVKHKAEKAGCKRLWLITTNDNLRAIGFYQRRGFNLIAVHQNALKNSRKLKPEIPEIGLDNIPLRDEIEFEMLLNQDGQHKDSLEILPEFPIRLARRTIYASSWISLYLDRVQLTTGAIIEDFHVVESARNAVAALVENEHGELLFEQVYRYPTGRLEWEIPAGGIDMGEDILAAAGREVFEETGYQTANHTLLYHYSPANGNFTARFFIVYCTAGPRTGKDDPSEILQSSWLSWDKINQKLAENEIQDGLTLTAILLLKQRRI